MILDSCSPKYPTLPISTKPKEVGSPVIPAHRTLSTSSKIPASAFEGVAFEGVKHEDCERLNRYEIGAKIPELVNAITEIIGVQNYIKGELLDRAKNQPPNVLEALSRFLTVRTKIEALAKESEKVEKCLEEWETASFWGEERKRRNVINPKTWTASNRDLSSVESVYIKSKIPWTREKILRTDRLLRQLLYERCSDLMYDRHVDDIRLECATHALVDRTGTKWNEESAVYLRQSLYYRDRNAV